MICAAVEQCGRNFVVQSSLRSSLFRFLSGKRESREDSGTEVTKKLVAGGRGREGMEKPAAEPRHFKAGFH